MQTVIVNSRGVSFECRVRACMDSLSPQERLKLMPGSAPVTAWALAAAGTDSLKLRGEYESEGNTTTVCLVGIQFSVRHTFLELRMTCDWQFMRLATTGDG